MTQRAIDQVQEVPFSAALREATRGDHSTAEGAGFLHELMSGALPVRAFVDLLVEYHAVYSVLEDAVDTMRSSPEVAPFADVRLRRVPALERDLDALAGLGWRATATLTPATQDYCARLAAVGYAWPAGLVAHHYTRYLGDLSGGQVIGRAIATRFGFAALAANGAGDGTGEESGAAPGTAFFDFRELGSPTRFKDAYRAALDTAPWDEQERERFIAETKVAYELNTRLLAGLGARWRVGAR